MKIKYQNITQRLDIITRHLTETRKIILLNFVIVFLASCIILPTSSTFAESFQSNEQVEFNLNPSISLSISGDLTIENLSPGDGKDSNIITVTATSNAIAGYNVSSTVGNNTHNYTTLNHSSNSNTFTNLSSNISSLTSFNDNTWGYSWCDGTCTSSSTWVSGAKGSTASGYNGLPLCNQATVSDCSGVTLIDETTNGSKTISFKIGAKASSTQADGTYSNVVNFVGVANPNPEPLYMQDATLADCGKIMIDKRDGSRYTTGLINNQCYMTRNLRIIGEVSASLSNFSHSSSFTTNYWDGVGCEPQSVIGQTIEDGAYYNYCAASAGTVDPWIADDASEDICPSNWKLPTANDFNNFPSSGIRNVWGSISAGYYSCWDGDGCYSQDYASHYWSATRAYDNDATQQVLHDVPGMGDWYLVDPYAKTEGYSIRCVLSS